MKVFTHIAAAAALTASLAASQAYAQEWTPNKPVHIIVPVVGTTNDILARLVGEKLEKVLGQPVVVENKGGAGGNIGADYVARAPKDGYTLLVGYNGPIAINPTLYKHLTFDPIKDFAPITLAVNAPQYLVANSKFPANSLKELVAWSKANPGKLSYASISPGSASHLTMEMLKEASGIDAIHVPYKGAPPALVDLVSGNVQIAFLVPGNVQEYVKDGRLKLLATSGSQRFADTPNVPTVAESGYPGFVATSWIGFLAPAGTPKNIVERYNKEIVAILKMPDVRKKLQDLQFEVVASTSDQFSDWIKSETVRWGKVVKSTGAQAD
jgi:tripartite-type tricarboxylate transporter receptor subunit TctC